MSRANRTTYATLAAFVMAAVIAVSSASMMASGVERFNARELRAAFDEGGQGWVQVQTDGLRAVLSGTAPDESARIRALRIAESVVDASRVSESIEVTTSLVEVVPVFRIEMMRNRDELSVIGLVPAEQGADDVVERLGRIGDEMQVADMLQSAAHPVPEGWVEALDFAVAALDELPVGRVSVTAGRIEVHALVPSTSERQRVEALLRGEAPESVVLMLDLVTPRPVIAPFALRFEIGADGARFDSCAADTNEARDRILRAARAAGSTDRLSCTVGMGAPSPRWSLAVEQALSALAELGAGTVTFSDASLSLVVPATVEQASFDRIVGRLETSLPDAFTLTAVRLEPENAGNANAETRAAIVATISAEGQVQIQGRLPNSRIRDSVHAFARARFGSDAVTLEARLDPELPLGWSLRVLTALEALSELHHGRAVVHENRVEVSGVSGNPDASAQVAGILSDGLGQGADYSVRVNYDQELDPVEQAPTPDRCVARIQEVLETDKITFAPGSARLDEQSRQALDRIAEVLQDCGALPLEVGGHTDSQGRAETNLRLSQARAETVINALLARRVLVSEMVARGYGPEQPIADNATAEGREANRRIEFTLIEPEPEPEPIDPALEALLEFEIQTPGPNTVRPAPRPERSAAP